MFNQQPHDLLSAISATRKRVPVQSWSATIATAGPRCSSFATPAACDAACPAPSACRAARHADPRLARRGAAVAQGLVLCGRGGAAAPRPGAAAVAVPGSASTKAAGAEAAEPARRAHSVLRRRRHKAEISDVAAHIARAADGLAAASALLRHDKELGQDTRGLVELARGGQPM